MYFLKSPWSFPLFLSGLIWFGFFCLLISPNNPIFACRFESGPNHQLMD
jgi:hypothetical protein